jgi:hypothetical protein
MAPLSRASRTYAAPQAARDLPADRSLRSITKQHIRRAAMALDCFASLAMTGKWIMRISGSGH